MEKTDKPEEIDLAEAVADHIQAVLDELPQATNHDDLRYKMHLEIGVLIQLLGTVLVRLPSHHCREEAYRLIRMNIDAMPRNVLMVRAEHDLDILDWATPEDTVN